MRSMTKNPNNYESMRKETNIYEQKPTNIDEFNDLGEADLKERVEKRKKKRGERLLKIINFRKKKHEENKVKEKEMWERNAKLNGDFKNIKRAKKETKQNVRNYYKLM